MLTDTLDLKNILVNVEWYIHPMNSCFSADLVLFHLLFLNNLANSSSRDYAAIVFFANNRFETGKKKLLYLTFQDFAFCAGQIYKGTHLMPTTQCFKSNPQQSQILTVTPGFLTVMQEVVALNAPLTPW